MPSGTIYCCKKCVDGVVKKYQSARPCEEIGAVKCSDSDPDCSGGGGGKTDCIPMPSSGVCPPGYPRKDRAGLQFRCCKESEDGGGGGNGDNGNVLYIPATQQCPEGYKDGGVVKRGGRQDLSQCRQQLRRCREQAMRRRDRGALAKCQEEYNRCVQEAQNPSQQYRKCIPLGGEDDDDNGGGGGEGEACAGGYKLSENPIKPEGGDIWTDEFITPEMGWRRDSRAEGHRIWHKEWGYQQLEDVHAFIRGETKLIRNDKGACRKGYKQTTINGEEWCCPGDGNGGGGGGGTWEWTPGTQEALARLLERYNWLLDYKRGTTPEERQAIINYATRGIKRGQRGEMQSMTDMLSRMGLAGGGFEMAQAQDIRRGTREDLANLQSKVAIDEIDRRFRELMGTTGMAQNLLGTVMSSEQIEEALNAARRGEGRDALKTLLSYLGMSMGGQGGDYMGALLNYILGQGGQGSGGGSDWMNWLMYLIGGRI